MKGYLGEKPIDLLMERNLARRGFEVRGHNFVSHKSEEMICWRCGFILWRTKDLDETTQALAGLGGTECNGKWM